MVYALSSSASASLSPFDSTALLPPRLVAAFFGADLAGGDFFFFGAAFLVGADFLAAFDFDFGLLFSLSLGSSAASPSLSAAAAAASISSNSGSGSSSSASLSSPPSSSESARLRPRPPAFDLPFGLGADFFGATAFFCQSSNQITQRIKQSVRCINQHSSSRDRESAYRFGGRFLFLHFLVLCLIRILCFRFGLCCCRDRCSA